MMTQEEIHGRHGDETPGSQHQRDRRGDRLSPQHHQRLVEERRTNGEAVESYPTSDRRALGRSDRRAGAIGAEVAGHQRLRADPGRGVSRLLCERGPASERPAGPEVPGSSGRSTRIETAPGEECQFDWSDVSRWTREWGLGEVQCFSAILSWSRVRIWWFARSIDREYTFEGLVRFFEHVGGVPKVLRTDRMGALGQSQGRRFTLHPPAAAFAQFHGTEIRACQARDAKRKGKVERPFRDVKERFLEECAATGAPQSTAELNERAARFLMDRIHGRMHRGSGAIPAERFALEAPMLGPLPRRRFDTAYVEARRVHVAIPQIEWRGVRYSVPPRCLGQRVEVRHEVDSETMEIRWAGEVVAVHTVADPTTGEVWDATHWQAAQQAALSRNRGRHLTVVIPDVAPEQVPLRLDIEGDVEVEVPDLARYETRGQGS